MKRAPAPFTRSTSAPSAWRSAVNSPPLILYERTIQFVGVFRTLSVVNYLADRLDHRRGRISLEDIPSHVHAPCTLVHCPPRHPQRLEFRKLLPTRDHNRDR